jgi:predicted  nucleic acid-binding Zn-ribbon protein
MFKKSRQNMINGVTNRFEKDIEALGKKSDNALSVFRQTAKNLEEVNAGYQEAIEHITQMRISLETKGNALAAKIADNSAVKKKILDIIGE